MVLNHDGQNQPWQEIKHADDPFGQEARDDTTGLAIWSASLVLARWLASDTAVKGLLAGKVVCELGAGCGVPGLAAAVHAKPAEVFLTDLNPETVANLRWVGLLNVDMLLCGGAWGEVSVVPQTAPIPSPALSTLHSANIDLNAHALPDPSLLPPIRALSMDWGEPASYPSSPVDVALGSDLVYQKSIGPLLSKVCWVFTQTPVSAYI